MLLAKAPDRLKFFPFNAFYFISYDIYCCIFIDWVSGYAYSPIYHENVSAFYLQPVIMVNLFVDQDVGYTGFIFQCQENDTFGASRALSAGYQAYGGDLLSVFLEGQVSRLYMMLELLSAAE